MAIPRRSTGHGSVESNAHQEPAVTQAEFTHAPANDLLDRQLLILLAPYVKADFKISVGGVSPGPPRTYGVTVGMKF